MFKAFNSGNSIASEINGDKYLIFEEDNHHEAKEEKEFNLIAIEFEKNFKYKYCENHYGYMVDVDKKDAPTVHLLIKEFGWGETPVLLHTDTGSYEEYDFVLDILRKHNVVVDFYEVDGMVLSRTKKCECCGDSLRYSEVIDNEKYCDECN